VDSIAITQPYDPALSLHPPSLTMIIVSFSLASASLSFRFFCCVDPLVTSSSKSLSHSSLSATKRVHLVFFGSGFILSIQLCGWLTLHFSPDQCRSNGIILLVSICSRYGLPRSSVIPCLDLDSMLCSYVGQLSHLTYTLSFSPSKYASHFFSDGTSGFQFFSGFCNSLLPSLHIDFSSNLHAVRCFGPGLACRGHSSFVSSLAFSRQSMASSVICVPSALHKSATVSALRYILHRLILIMSVSP
jgi:hypothetical protein